MFGFSFGEIMVLVIVGIVVVGPRKLPEMMRTLGQWIAKIRRLSTDLRAQSGIDELIRIEGLEREMRELRALSRVNVIETLVTPVVGSATAGSVVQAAPRLPARPAQPTVAAGAEPEPQAAPEGEAPVRAREYPSIGCDHYGAFGDDEDPYADEPEDEAPPEGDFKPGAEAETAAGREGGSA